MNTSQTSEQSDGEMLTMGRLVPVRREGKKVFARTLRWGEEDNGEAVHLEAGDQLIIAAGDLVIDSRQIDAHSPKGLGGYAQVANTVWTFYQFAPVKPDFFLYFYALAQRLDTAHSLWTSTVQEREQAKISDGISRRLGYFSSLGKAELAVIALHRAMRMLHALVEEYNIEVPGNVQRLWKPIEEMRHAFEHIDDRARGKSGQSGKSDPGALSVFFQPDFLESSIIHYKEYSLHFDEEFLSALMECRGLVMTIIDATTGATASKV